MQKRIFITIDLPEEIKKGFMEEESRWKNLRVFWTGFSHYSLTFEYLGIVDKEDLKKIKNALQEVVEETKPFEIRLDRIVLGPNEKDPRMFWATIFEDGAVKTFHNQLIGKLAENGFETKERDFIPHIVLATAKGNQLKGRQTNVRLRGKFKVEEINLYSSQTYAKGATKHKLLETFPFEK